MSSNVHAVRHAEQLVEASEELRARGNRQRAKQALERAEEFYEQAGLDPRWFNEEALNEMWRLKGQRARPLDVEVHGDGQWLELTDRPGRDQDGKGIMFTADSLDVTEP